MNSMGRRRRRSAVAAAPAVPFTIAYAFTGNSLDATTTDASITAGTITNGSLFLFQAYSSGYATDPVFQTQSEDTSLAAAVTNARYFSFSLTPAVGKTMNLSSIALKAARGGASTPRGYGVRSSADTYAADIVAADLLTERFTWTAVSADLSAAAYQGLTGAITFRVYSYSPTRNTVEFDDITVTGTVV